MNLNSVVSCLVAVVIIFVLGNTKVEGTQGDMSSVRGPSSVCNGTVGECGTGDEVELLLMDTSTNRLLAQAPKKSFIITDVLKQTQLGCYHKCVKANNPMINNRPCDRCDFFAQK